MPCPPPDGWALAIWIGIDNNAARAAGVSQRKKTNPFIDYNSSRKTTGCFSQFYSND
jgi:hypothetical protein